MAEEFEKVRCLIIGSGPAGYTAAVYAARADLHPVLYQGMEPGGQLTTTTDVDNYPGYPEGVEGPQMMEDFKRQAERFDTDVRMGFVTEVDFSERPFKVKADDGKSIIADTVIIATGASAKYLGLPSEEKYKGGGVSACATCDGFFYKGLNVAVVGGGDTAVEEATYLANLAKKVYLIHRRDELRASKAMQKRAFNTENIEIIWNHNVVEVLGEESAFNKKVTGAKLQHSETGETKEIQIDGFFLGIGHKPNTDIFKGQIDMDDNGYIKTKPNMTHTNVPGVFAAGDVKDPIYRQAVTSAGSGCQAAMDAERFLGEVENE